jgi:uncharacterized phage protein (TIGR01671 family)
MAREILFRGKEIVGGKWREGHLVACKNNGRTFITELIEVDEDSWLYWEVDPNSIGQYIGITDKNDKKIFEGDIVTHPLTDTKGIVQWMGSGFVVQEPKHDEHGDYYYALNDGDKKTTVIGNIHDNPDLPCQN